MTAATWAIFTDLDGTLFDAQMKCDASESLLQRLRAANVPVVPVTSRTFDELETIADAYGFDQMILEGGSVIASRNGDRWHIETFGGDADQMLDVIREIERLADADLAVYSVMSPDEASRVSGLTGDALLRSQRRRSDEPFVITRGRLESIAAAARKMGFTLWRDGVLFHLSPRKPRATALAFVREALGCTTRIGLGDSAVDAEFLSRCDVVVIVPRPNGVPDPELVRALPGARIAPASADVGWAAAITEIWSRMDSRAKRYSSPARLERAEAV